MLVRPWVERGQEDLARLGRQFQVGGDVEEVAREPRRVHRHQPDLLEAGPEIAALGHDFEDAAEQVVGVAQGLERLPVELAPERRSRLRGAGQ